MVVGEFTRETHLLVIGGGPAGYTAAFRAAELGIETVLVDPRESLGGVCLHEGCIPSKTLLHAAETVRRAERASEMGIRFGKPAIDVTALRDWVSGTVDKLARALAGLVKKHGVEVIRGEARFENGKQVAVPGSSTPRIKFRRAIIATGSEPIEHPALPFDGTHVLRAHEAVRLPRVPEKLLVVGGGYQAVEIACVYAALGAAVTLSTPDKRVLAEADHDLARPLERRLRETLAGVLTGGEPPEASDFDMVVVAGAQRARLGALDPAKAGVDLDDEASVIVDSRQCTSCPRILAAGDVTGPPRLADRGMVQGRVAAEVVAGWGSEFDARALPMVVFTDPQVTWCGLTEERAKAEGIRHAVRKIPWGASGRAVGMGRGDGLTKIIYDPDVKLVLGVGLAGPGAAEMIAEGCLAIEMGAALADLAGTIHPHPTTSELLADAARFPSSGE